MSNAFLSYCHNDRYNHSVNRTKCHFHIIFFFFLFTRNVLFCRHHFVVCFIYLYFCYSAELRKQIKHRIFVNSSVFIFVCAQCMPSHTSYTHWNRLRNHNILHSLSKQMGRKSLKQPWYWYIDFILCIRKAFDFSLQLEHMHAAWKWNWNGNARGSPSTFNAAFSIATHALFNVWLCFVVVVVNAYTHFNAYIQHELE